MIIQKQNSNIPQLVFVGMMFFVIGFTPGINLCLIPVINGTLGVSSAQAYLILTAIFSTLIIFNFLSYPINY